MKSWNKVGFTNPELLRNPEFTPKLITVVFRTSVSNGEKYKAVIHPYVTDGEVSIDFDSYIKLSQILV
ncbi:MAG: hypothetical protein PHG66_01130 [Candidatus Colwellbacteria bacterium]|nr:hypothetical protein [Candidatus Colwellbacteria bacterium]